MHKPQRRFSRTLIALAVAAALTSASAAAQTNQWQGTDQNWSDNANWTLGSVPAAGEDVRVTDEAGGDASVSYSGDGTGTFGSMVINGVTLTHTVPEGLATNALVVGATGGAAYLLVGTTATVTINNNAIIGEQAGSNGAFGQSAAGSSVLVGGDLVIGEASEAIGSYNQFDGALTVTGRTIVGAAGSGSFYQAGVVHASGGLTLGRDQGSYGGYNLEGGELNDDAIVGDAGSGAFNNIAATHNVTGDLILGNQATGNGAYSLTQGGAVTVTGDSIVGNAGTGSVSHVNGTHDTSNLYLGAQAGATGSYQLDAGQLTITNTLGIGVSPLDQQAAGAGAFVQNGGSVTTAGFYQGSLSAGSPSTYTLNGGTLNSGSFASMSDNSSFDQAGGIHTNTGGFFLGNSGGSDFDTVYRMTDASAQANFNALIVGGFGRGILEQSFGAVTATTLVVGDGPNIDPTRRFGRYDLGGGTLTAANAVVGAGNNDIPNEPGGLGTVYQSGDSAATITNDLIIGQYGFVLSNPQANNSGTGTWTVSDNATLDVGAGVGGSLIVAQGGATGTLNQSGGAVTVDGYLIVGEDQDALGTVNLSAGTLTSGNAIIGGGFLGNPNGGTGVINQTGGTYETNYLNLGGGGFAQQGTGVYTLDAGALVVNNNMILGNANGGSAQVTQNGGTVEIKDGTFGLFINDGGYALNGGSLDVTANMLVGDVASGSFDQQAGSTLNVGGRLVLGNTPSVTGTQTMTGGTATVGRLIVGEYGNGVLDISGGSLAATNDPLNLFSITVGNQAGSTGSVTVSGTGTLTAANRLTVGAEGAGTLTQSGSGTVNAAGLRVGEGASSTSTYTMNGGTLNALSTEGVNGGARVGLAGTGTFTQNGGTFNTTFMQIGGTTFGQGGGGNGTVTLNGGSLVASGNIAINPDDASLGVLNVAGGSLTAATVSNHDRLNYSAGAITTNVTNAAAFNVSGGVARTLTGNLTNDTGGTVTVAAATPFTVTGVLTQGAGAAIQAGANVIVGKDYVNLGAGSGNSFDRRAGVSGAGQILGNNAAQTITGNVAAAGADTWTLDLGNVRGGSGPVTKNYQIGNTGSGADIRGAIQTAGQGNITDARLSGQGVTAGNFGPIAAGGNSGDLAVTFSGVAGTALSGQTIAVVSNFENVATQVINLTGGAVSALAVGSATPSPGPVDLGNFRVNGTLPSQGFAVTNTTTGDGAERLGVGSVSTTGNFAGTNNLGGGFINPGAPQSSAVSAAVSGGTAGTNNGSLTIQYTTNGQLIDPTFTTINSNAQTINLEATGYNAAVGSTTPDPIVIANQRVNGSLAQQLTVANAAPTDGFSESLNASFGANTGAATNNGGAVNLIAAGASDNTQMTVGIDTATSGAKSGTATVSYVTDGTGTSGLAAAAAGSQVIQVSGNVYQLAAGQINTAPLNFGTVQVGQAVSQTLSISNVASGAAGFVEDLNASFGASSGTGAGLISGIGSISGLLAGTANATNMVVSVDTGAAATVNGAIAVNFVSAGAVNGVSNGLGVFGLGAVDYGVSGIIQTGGQIVDQAKPVTNGTASPTAVNVNLANVRVGTTSEQTLSVQNQATGNAQAALNASVASNGLPVTAGGSFNLLNPGATNNTSLVVGVGTGSAGAKSGTATISFVSDAGNIGGCAPNCQLNLASQTVNVSGGVFNVAQPAVPASVDVGNFRLGSAPAPQAISIANTDISPAGFQEGLNASIGSTAGQATATGGPIINLAQGGTSNAISVGIDNALATAGANSGSVTLSLASNGTGTSGLPTLGLSDATLAVTGTGYRLANPIINTPSILLAARIGDVLPTAAVSVTNSSPDIYTEGLDASVGSVDSGFTALGAISNLPAAATNSTSIGVGLASTAVSENITGNLTLDFASTGAGTTGAAAVGVGQGTVALTGRVYQQAVADVQTPTMDLGIARVGDTVATQNVAIGNIATGALTDVLQGGFGTVAGPFTGQGNLGTGVVAGDVNNTSLNVGINTATAGVFSGNAQLNLLSHNADMADLVLTPPMLNLSAQVNAYANATYEKTGGLGSLTGLGPLFTLDLGSIVEGSTGVLMTSLRLLNKQVANADMVTGIVPQDNLAGTFDAALNGLFGFTNFADFTGLAAGFDLTNLLVDFDPTGLTAGHYSGVMLLSASSIYAGLSDYGLGDVRLLVTALVTGQGDVPEPSIILLLLPAVPSLIWLRRRRRV